MTLKKVSCAIWGLSLLAASALSSNLKAATPDDILQEYTAEAKKTDKAFKGFSADAGKKFFMAERTNSKGEKESCTKCHTADPTKSGKTRAGKAIEPMAVAANKERFTDKAKVEKWFKRNCQDVYERACTVQEKGDFIAFMKIAK
jgi:Domain of unknown function (DUF1924)